MKQPEGTKPMVLDFEYSHGPFDYDAVKDNPDVEIWIVRVPKEVRRIASSLLSCLS